MDEDPFAKNAQGIIKVYHEVLLLMNFLLTKLQVMNMIINYYDLYYRVIKNWDDKEIINDKFEIDYNNYEDFITPDHYVGRKKIIKKYLRREIWDFI